MYLIPYIYISSIFIYTSSSSSSLFSFPLVTFRHMARSTQTGSSSTAINNPDYYLCVCGQRMYVRTSWTDKNPGRRFVKCPKMKTLNCERFRFIDEELPPHYKKLLYELRSESFNGGIDDLSGVEVKQGQMVWMKELTFQESTLKYYDRSMLLLFSIIVMLGVVIVLLVSK